MGNQKSTNEAFDWSGVNRKMFTKEEQLLLQKYGWFYRELMNGERTVETPKQQRFLQMCQAWCKNGETVETYTEHEKVWLKYLQIRYGSRPTEATVSTRKKLSSGPRINPTQNPSPQSIPIFRNEHSSTGKPKKNPDAVPGRDALPEEPPKKRIIDESPVEKSEIPEYESGLPNPSWYPGRDRSKMRPGWYNHSDGEKWK